MASRKAWELAPALVEAEADDECLDKLSAQFPGKTLEFALRRMSATIEVEKILRQIESGAAADFRTGQGDQRIHLHGPVGRERDRPARGS